MEVPIIDHLFRHHYGKMVSILTRVFGLSHLETIEDAVQDTFIKATVSWRKQLPDNPEAWLTKAAKNRVLDIFRQIKASKNRENLVQSSAEAMAMTELLSLNSSPLTTLNMALVYLQLKKPEQAYELLQTIKAPEFNQRAYLYYGAWAEYYLFIGATEKALVQLDLALNEVQNAAERMYLQKKRNMILQQN